MEKAKNIKVIWWNEKKVRKKEKEEKCRNKKEEMKVNEM